jgi:hypothetical protein
MRSLDESTVTTSRSASQVTQIGLWLNNCSGASVETPIMARGQDTVDRHPGTLPDIRTHTGSITFVMAPPGLPKRKQLAIRCDAEGEVWISILPDQAPSDL